MEHLTDYNSQHALQANRELRLLVHQLRRKGVVALCPDSLTMQIFFPYILNLGAKTQAQSTKNKSVYAA